MGKGDKPRPIGDKNRYDRNHDRIFGTDNEQTQCIIEGCTNTTTVTEGAPATKLCTSCFAERFEG